MVSWGIDVSHLIQEIQDTGRLIVLDDGSTWTVNAADAFSTLTWAQSDRVEIGFCTLTNVSRTNETVRAVRMKVQRAEPVPAAPAPRNSATS
jgi:hypothetical protein